ncbi:hypothetical protein FCM35_KLT14662 [Carex littledalei]|uniref:Uncharacterized protein n=1 Tax=Carex littledalei TaxID=544730 RepID=A0A833QMT5_9POAL|nr:hypothetical protein FCM35_KLT14662 [Carex littledalei]
MEISTHEETTNLPFTKKYPHYAERAELHLLESIKCKLDTLSLPYKIGSSTIFRVPYKLRQSKENLFAPSVVSIGPFHHGHPRFETTEEQKWQFLRDFLSRGDHISLNHCLSEISKLEERARRCYNESVPLDSNRFCLIMLLDGCFVLEYFLKWYGHRLNSIGHSVFVLSDLLLVENQIPFFVVEKLFDIGIGQDQREDFTKYLAYNFSQAGPAVLDASIVPDPPAEIHHFVHLSYHCSIPSDPSKPFVPSSESCCPCCPCCPSMLSTITNLLLEFSLWVLTRIFRKSNSLSLPFQNPTRKRLMVIPCATELQNAGIKLRPKSNPDHMLDISFHHRVLEIPRLAITNESKTLLVNLIAFEQSKSDEMNANLSSFALFLDSLVNTPNDVMILQKCGILHNGLDSDEELTDFFNQICQGMVVKDDHFLAELFAQVNKYFYTYFVPPS